MAYVMVVDDNEDLAAFSACVLGEEGHEVAVRFDTASALTDMRNRPPDLAILDVMFPGDDFAGMELARAMRKDSGLKRIPIIMLTGVNQELGMEFSSLDADNSWLPITEFMDKPVKPEKLVVSVRAILQAAGAQSK